MKLLECHLSGGKNSKQAKMLFIFNLIPEAASKGLENYVMPWALNHTKENTSRVILTFKLIRSRI